MSQEYLTVKQAAALLRVSKSFLDKARMTGTGPPYFLCGKAVRYRRSDVDQWADQRLRTSTMT